MYRKASDGGRGKPCGRPCMAPEADRVWPGTVCPGEGSSGKMPCPLRRNTGWVRIAAEACRQPSRQPDFAAPAARWENDTIPVPPWELAMPESRRGMARQWPDACPVSGMAHAGGYRAARPAVIRGRRAGCERFPPLPVPAPRSTDRRGCGMIPCGEDGGAAEEGRQGCRRAGPG